MKPHSFFGMSMNNATAAEGSKSVLVATGHEKVGNTMTLSVLAGRRKLISFAAILKESGITFNVTTKGG
jgi:hypothetical protein